ncbi:MAG: pyridoxal phosphate-dependent aminotransferase [Candidatus Thorarchaeota archaeon]
MKYRTDRLMAPPILKLIEAAKHYVSSPEFLNLGPGLPGHIPPADSLKAFGNTLLHPATHRYTFEQGQLELREELAIYLRQNWSVQVDPEKEISITGGANAAFAGAIFTVLSPGEKVVMPSPFYFNSVMAVRLAGGEVAEVPVGSDFQVSYDQIESAVDKETRAIFINSPNNPTGAVYSREIVDSLVDLCIDRDLFLISDETYGRLVYEGASHYSPRSRSDAHERIISLGSFSKDFGMSGWRVGYVVGSDEFMQEFMKVQDTVTICASTPGQMLALEILKHGLDEIQEEIDRISLLRNLAYLRISEIPTLETARTPATFYIFPRVNGCTDSRKLVLDILRETKMLVLPGSIFGEAGESHLRISIGPLTPEAVDEAFDRLSAYFRNH